MLVPAPIAMVTDLIPVGIVEPVDDVRRVELYTVRTVDCSDGPHREMTDARFTESAHEARQLAISLSRRYWAESRVTRSDGSLMGWAKRGLWVWAHGVHP